MQVDSLYACSEFFIVTGSGQNVLAQSYGGGGLTCSTDNGNTWKEINNGISPGSVESMAVQSSNAYGVANDTLFECRNLGPSWTPVTASSMDTALITEVAVSGDNILAACGNGGVYLSSDSGTSWKCVSDVPHVGKFTTSGSDVYAERGGNPSTDTSAGIYFSSDNGESWTHTSESMTSAIALAAGPSALFAVTATSSGVLSISRSNDAGRTWSLIGTFSLSYVLYGIPTPGLIVSNSDLYLACQVGVYGCKSYAHTWQSFNAGMPPYGGAGPWANSIYINDSSIFVGTNFNGLWRRPISQVEVTGVKPRQATPTPASFALNQNYPNPFNPTTAISYKLSAVGHVTLKVYDILGREVGTLVDRREQAGTYTIDFDGASLASGVYFYRLIAGNHVVTRKMLLLK